MLLTASAPAIAQPVVDDPKLEELRVRAPSGDNDNRTIDDWIKRELGKLGPGMPASSTSGLRSELRRIRTDPSTHAACSAALSTRLGVVAAEELADGAKLGPVAATELVWAMIDVDDPSTEAGLAAALKHPRMEVRYLAAVGLRRLRDRIASAADPSKKAAYISVIREAGVAETNGVIVERLYDALAFPTVTDASFDAIVAILDARLKRYQDGAPLIDDAEPTLIEYCAHATFTQVQTAKIVRRLAVLLRLDVERMANDHLVPAERDALERRIIICEELLKQWVRPAAGEGGNLQREIAVGGATVGPVLKLELINWIGSPQSPGVLNASPWNVPVAAPLP